MLDQVAQHGVGEPVLVGPLRVAEDAVELVRVGRLDGAHGRLERPADVRGRLPHVAPVAPRRNLEAVVLRVARRTLRRRPIPSSAACVSSSKTSQSRLKKSSGKMNCL